VMVKGDGVCNFEEVGSRPLKYSIISLGFHLKGFGTIPFKPIQIRNGGNAQYNCAIESIRGRPEKKGSGKTGSASCEARNGGCRSRRGHVVLSFCLRILVYLVIYDSGSVPD